MDRARAHNMRKDAAPACVLPQLLVEADNVLVSEVEEVMDQDSVRVQRAADVMASVLSPAGLCVLDGYVSADAIGRALDSMPKKEVQTIIGSVLEELERRLDPNPAAALDRALDLAELAARHHLPQKLLLLLLAMGMPPKQLLAVDPGVVLGGLMLLGLMPLPLVAAASGAVGALAKAVAALPQQQEATPADEAKTA
ncbi:hypothetical protein HYH03_018295 [Edaphochlamys debaryana]|uniref:Uncharacterized protein n=1 Tax=Edaphochlamys debaryana TaxID=47281 RepID=A0A835XGB0_9CHLO|nr:hypothetical protein HYH03_018295 [Edaphochlamys debaryana]|eukprot:KAG2482805.1 hypothetical protein HYH03_018295 [Edaphochlamys debaryana]